MDAGLSYAQRYEDLHLLRCFGAQASGFYIDIGAGHPVYDNVSFAFYLRGWRGITVEPNPWLSQLSAAVRPHDHRVEALVGAAPGEATYYLVDDFHGLSTTIEGHARAAQAEYGKAAQAITKPVTTLAALCERHAPAAIDFLKIDVEGAEHDVLAGGDWQRFRPKVVVLEALWPVTLQPAWEAWEPLLTGQQYRFAWFDGLNRYYVAEDDAERAAQLAAAPPLETIKQFRALGRAREDASHPDHHLARLLADLDPVRLPLLNPEALVGALTAELPAGELARLAAPEDAAAAADLLGGQAHRIISLDLHRNATIRMLYERLIATDEFRAACGRISASHAW